MSLIIYEYKNCSTCVKALKSLDQRKVAYQRIPIIEQPPKIPELKLMLNHVKRQGGTIKNLFNTSGVLYREMNIAQKLKAGLTEDEALQLLSKNGKLIKRPFALSKNFGTVGYQEELWTEHFK